jgi:cytochrome c oxidase accessory protein FixG
MNPFELHPERLATTDETGGRIFMHPADVRGFFQKRRAYLRIILINIFLWLPWLQIDGRQALLLDLPHRRFEFFGLSLRAHNAPLLVFVFATIGFGLFFVTAIWGRIWCGWACPQTVFIEGVFRKIERWIEGTHLERKKLNTAPWNLDKIKKRLAKWSLFLVCSLIITHSFLAYFVGTGPLAEMVTKSPFENWSSFLFILITSGIILFDFGWFREQFCIIACPYGRFQSVLMDDHSKVIIYDIDRGEPRSTPALRAAGTATGDCVNCYRCVQVCPTGIDIRRGVQLECIGCTACIDACDEVMTKIKKPIGLIRYDTQAGLLKKPRKIWRPRVIIYFAVILIAIFSLGTILSMLKAVDVEILRAKEAPYTINDGIVANHFKIELSNRTDILHQITFESESGFELVTAFIPVLLQPNDVTRIDVFIRFPKSALRSGQKKIILKIHDHVANTSEIETLKKDVTLVGPFS